MPGKEIFGFLAVLSAAHQKWRSDKAQSLGAALAFYVVFSLAPLLIIIVAIVGLVFGERAAQGMVVEQLQELIGSQNAEILQTLIQHVSKPRSEIAASIVGVAAL